MNTNLGDLMYQSGLTADGCWDQMDKYDQEAIMKFAELIVKRCVSVYEYDPSVYHEVNVAKILEYFGVEE